MTRKRIGTLEAKTRLSAILDEVCEGRSFYITRHGEPIAELRPPPKKARMTRAGFARGTFTRVADDFDAPLEDFAPYVK